MKLNGNLVLKQTFKGTYQVNPDCTGSGTLIFDVPPGLVGHSVFVIDDGGTELRGLQTDAGSVVTILGRPQFPVGD